MKVILAAVGAFLVGIVATFLVIGDGNNGDTAQSSITPNKMADAVHVVIEADRTAYSKNIVNRLVNEEKVIKATEHWKEDKSLLLPAQMFRAGAELAQKNSSDFSYALLSLWPINKQNKAKTPAEREGLQAVIDHPNEPFYKEETLGKKRYFTAVYADVGVAPACITCHNEHKDSPRKDFELGETMGGVVIRIPLD